MEFTPMGDDKLKIRLDKRDMDKYGIVYESLCAADENTRHALLRLLEEAKEDTGFYPHGSKLFIEAYKSENGGCCLYFTIIHRPSRISDNQSIVAPVTFEFDDCESLLTAACKTFAMYGHRIYKSSLYVLNGKYRLLVYSLDYIDRLSIYFLSEYGRPLRDEISAAYTAERGREIIADCALETLSDYFG